MKGTGGTGAGAPAVVLDIPVEQIRPMRGQPREHFDRDQLAELRRSMAAVGQQVPVTLIQTGPQAYELVDGERRWRCAKFLRIQSLRAVVQDQTDAEDRFLTSVVSNFARASHTYLETARALARLERHPRVRALSSRGEQIEFLAATFGRTDVWVRQHLSLTRLVPEVVARCYPTVPKDQGLSFEALLWLAQMSPEEQRAIAKVLAARRLTGRKARAYVWQARTKQNVAAASEGRGPARPQSAAACGGAEGGGGALAGRSDRRRGHGGAPAHRDRARLAARYEEARRDDRGRLSPRSGPRPPADLSLRAGIRSQRPVCRAPGARPVTCGSTPMRWEGDG